MMLCLLILCCTNDVVLGDYFCFCRCIYVCKGSISENLLNKRALYTSTCKKLRESNKNNQISLFDITLKIEEKRTREEERRLDSMECYVKS